jgi:hypothetical protein
MDLAEFEGIDLESAIRQKLKAFGIAPPARDTDNSE